MELRVGNKYRLGRKIGSGSFGDIYLGEWKQSNFKLKVLCRIIVPLWCKKFNCDVIIEFILVLGIL